MEANIKIFPIYFITILDFRVSSLNCDYKLAAKAIANRLKIFLPNLINNDQTGFIKDRFIDLDQYHLLRQRKKT